MAGVLLASAAWSEDLSVCPSPGPDCRFAGLAGLQQAIDAAADGGIVHLRSGRYVGDGYRDVEFADLIIRGRVVVQSKAITVTGGPDTVLDGSGGEPASLLVVNRGRLTLRNVTVANTRTASAEDDVYDGHGVFVVDGAATLQDVTFRAIEKMALSIRGDSSVRASGVRLLDGHVGVWIEERSRLSLRDCVVANNDSAGVAAYADAEVEVDGCAFDRNLDDGLYAAERARIHASKSLFVNNAPYAVRNVDDAVIQVTDSTFYDNAAVANDARAVRIRSSRLLPGYGSAQDDRHDESPADSSSQ